MDIVCDVYRGGPWDGLSFAHKVDDWPPLEVLPGIFSLGGCYRRVRYASMPTWEADTHCVVRAAEYEWVEASHD